MKHKINFTEKEIREKVDKIIVDVLNIEDKSIIKDNVSIIDLGDSLDFVEMIMTLEKEFNIEISDDDAEEIRYVSDIYEYLLPIKERRKLKLD